MQCSVFITVELDPIAGVAGWEQAVQDAGREAMRQALVQAVRRYEETHDTCPHCGSLQSHSQGMVRRRVLTGFGRVRLELRRQRCDGWQRRFRPAQGCLASGATGARASDARLGAGMRAGGRQLAVCDRRPRAAPAQGGPG